jgi:hypothetical protein
VFETGLFGPEDERSRTIGRRAATNAFVVLTGLLLAEVVAHLLTSGLANLGAVGYEFALVVVGFAVYAGTGLYYTRTS